MPYYQHKNNSLATKVDQAARERLVDVCHYNDGSLSDLMEVYDIAVDKLKPRYKYMDKPSHIYATAFRMTVRYFGYERDSLP
jgi:hypothetical protein